MMTLSQYDKTTSLAIFNQFFHWLAIGITIPVSTLFLQAKGLDLVEIGITFGCYGAATTLFELPTGGLADTVGRKKVYLMALVIMACSTLLLLFLDNYLYLILAFLLAGISRSLSSGSLDAHFIDEFYRIDPKVNIQKKLAIIGFFVPIGLGVGCLIGGFLPLWTRDLYNPYAINYFVHLGLLVFQYVTTKLLIHEQKHPKLKIIKQLKTGFSELPQIIQTSIKQGFKNKILFMLLIGAMVWGFCFSGLERLLQPLVLEISNNNDASWISGIISFLCFTAASIGSLLSSRICALFNNNYAKVLIASKLIMGLVIIFLALQVNVAFMSLYYILIYIGNGIAESPESALINNEIDSSNRSTFLSLSSLFMQLGGIMGSVLLSFIAQVHSMSYAWIVISCIMLLSITCYVKINHFLPESEKSEL